jgi:hypothetical protein
MLSLREALDFERFFVVAGVDEFSQLWFTPPEGLAQTLRGFSIQGSEKYPTMDVPTLGRVSTLHKSRLFAARRVSAVEILSEVAFAVLWERTSPNDDRIVIIGERRAGFYCPVPGSTRCFGFVAHKASDSVYAEVVFNVENPFVQWMLRFRDLCRKGELGLDESQYTRVVEKAVSATMYPSIDLGKLRDFVAPWETSLPQEIRPPTAALDAAVFSPRHDHG